MLIRTSSWPYAVTTELLFRADPYLRTASARVVALHEHGIELDRTIFYPTGGGRVRLVSIPGIDLQPCGGTHVRNIAEIGTIRVLRIRSEGKRNRRVEIALSDHPPS